MINIITVLIKWDENVPKELVNALKTFQLVLHLKINKWQIKLAALCTFFEQDSVLWHFLAFKVIVHFKMKILSSFTQPQVVSNLNYGFLLNTKEDIFKNVGNQTVDGPHWPLLWKSMESINCLVIHIHQHIYELVHFKICELSSKRTKSFFFSFESTSDIDKYETLQPSVEQNF